MEKRTLTRREVQAVRNVMHLFRDDDLAQGVSRSARRWCACCNRPRPAAGFITYDALAFCNCCAVGFEFARLRHLARTAAEYADRLPARHADTAPAPISCSRPEVHAS